MDENEVIDFYEELIETLQSLNSEAPKIRKLYDSATEELEQALSDVKKTVDNAKEELNKAETSGMSRIAKLSAERKKQIDNQIQALEDTVKSALKLQKALGVSAEYAQQIEDKFDKLTEHLNLLAESMEEQQNQFGKLEQRIMLLEGKLNLILPVTEIDYDELSTAIELYNKYNGKIDRPIVLEKTNYTNGYCFRVSGINEEEETLIGRYYRQGKLYGNNTTFAFSTRCRMFNGDTLEDVIRGEI